MAGTLPRSGWDGRRSPAPTPPVRHIAPTSEKPFPSRHLPHHRGHPLLPSPFRWRSPWVQDVRDEHPRPTSCWPSHRNPLEKGLPILFSSETWSRRPLTRPCLTLDCGSSTTHGTCARPGLGPVDDSRDLCTPRTGSRRRLTGPVFARHGPVDGVPQPGRQRPRPGRRALRSGSPRDRPPSRRDGGVVRAHGSPLSCPRAGELPDPPPTRVATLWSRGGPAEKFLSDTRSASPGQNSTPCQRGSVAGRLGRSSDTGESASNGAARASRRRNSSPSQSRNAASQATPSGHAAAMRAAST
ncbi:uncharacterized protein CMC5_002340 [Chondromyces crocatus]|uniref:Uncharacterized protein n=1 Tax=Chondromyces crocatus TaxID=52 RepID=A0A0K1E5H1_CHOCO|nr:uncharacterized protein CMC5_002340 [Chondromyces crocatus]